MPRDLPACDLCGNTSDGEFYCTGACEDIDDDEEELRSILDEDFDTAVGDSTMADVSYRRLADVII